MKSATLLVAAVLLAGCDTAPTALPAPAAPALRAETITQSVKIPFDLVVFIECANGGAGEEVALSGTLHDLFHITINDAGAFVFKFHDQPQGISGTGLTTGDKYQATGVTQQTQTLHGTVGETITFVNNFRIIGPGPGNNFLIHETFHVTVNANGTVTAEVDNFRAECK